MSSKIIRVLVVDDHNLVRKAISHLIHSDANGIHVVGEAASGEEALEKVQKLMPDVTLMDLQMPGMGGIEATRKLIQRHPDLKVLALTVCDSEVFPARLLEDGAAGYVTKDSSSEEVIRAIKAVHAGQRYISPDIAQKMALQRYSGKSSSPFDSLSEREFQVMMMITNGKKVQEIAETLNLSPKTVNTYRYRLFEKLNVKSDVELTHLALRNNIVNVENVRTE
jgi:two-component system invasion response regulator UvrY